MPKELNWLVVLLFVGLLLFSVAVIITAIALPANERVYVFLVGVAGNFNGALFMHIQYRDKG